VAKDAAIDAGLVAKSARMGAKTALAGGGAFPYRASQATSEDRTSFEFVVYGHGPGVDGLAGEYVELIREWDRVHRHGPGARIEVYPAATPDAEIPEAWGAGRSHSGYPAVEDDSVDSATTFEEDGVVPDAVALRDAFADPDGAVSGGVVQGDAGAVLSEDRGLQGPQVGAVSLGHLLVDQGFADAAAAVAIGDIDGRLGDAGVALAS
jgi:hypothetical protein